jgi:threonine dehydrogenase-like Zn-dependent dehydrogenase
MDHTCSKCRYEAKHEANFWHNGVLYRTCNLHRGGAEGNQVFCDPDSFARVLRENIDNQVGSSNESESVVTGFTFHVNFSGIIENSSCATTVTSAKSIAVQVMQKIQRADGFEYRYISFPFLL